LLVSDMHGQAMRVRRLILPATIASLLAVVGACGAKAPADPKNREIPWTYGPTTGGATAEHVRGTGTKGGPPVAAGWQFRLQDGTRLTVVPFRLAETHPLFGKVALSVGLFDIAGKQLGSFRSEAITAQNATASFDLTEDVATKLNDVVIWYRAL